MAQHNIHDRNDGNDKGKSPGHEASNKHGKAWMDEDKTREKDPNKNMGLNLRRLDGDEDADRNDRRPDKKMADDDQNPDKDRNRRPQSSG